MKFCSASKAAIKNFKITRKNKYVFNKIVNFSKSTDF